MSIDYIGFSCVIFEFSRFRRRFGRFSVYCGFCVYFSFFFIGKSVCLESGWVGLFFRIL